MADQTAICNLALLRLGEVPLGSIDENNKAANALRAIFEASRDIVLADHPWNFASRRATLAQLSETPAFGYAYAYQLPAQCLRVLGMVGDEYNVDPALEYKIEGDQLLTNESEAKIQYIIRVTATGSFSPGFVNALGTWLAKEVAFYLTRDAAITQAMEKRYNEIDLPRARSIDAQEDTAVKKVSNPWVEARI